MGYAIWRGGFILVGGLSWQVAWDERLTNGAKAAALRPPPVFCMVWLASLGTGNPGHWNLFFLMPQQLRGVRKRSHFIPEEILD